MYIAIDRYIIEIRSFELENDKIMFYDLGLEFCDQSEIKIIYDEIIKNIPSCNMIIDLRSKELPKFVSFINANEGGGSLMTFIFDNSIVVSQDWFIKKNSVITKENGENLFWVTKYYSGSVNEILNQLKEHPSFIDLRT